MKNKLMILALILSMAINLSVLGTIGYHFRAERCGDRHGSRHGEGTWFDEELGMSESQAKQFKLLRGSFHRKTQKVRAELADKRSQLLRLLSVSEPNMQEIHSKLEEIEALQLDLQKRVVTHMLEEKNVLTPEQQRKFFFGIEREVLHESRCQHDDEMERR